MDEGKPFYITTAIDYPNSRPHIGTAFEKIGADVQARFRRMEGLRRPFPDGQRREHHQGDPAPGELGVDPQGVRRRHGPPVPGGLAARWRSPTTTSSRRARSAITPAAASSSRRCTTPATSTRASTGALLRRLRGVQDREGSGRRQAGTAPTTRARRSPGSKRRTTSSGSPRIATDCSSYYAAHPEFIQPESRRNEIVNLVETELRDVAITRKGFTWGIPVPFDPSRRSTSGSTRLLNYITGIGYGTDEAKFRRLWPADVHVIGKDITRFHCALWPAMLMSAGGSSRPARSSATDSSIARTKRPERSRS